MIIIDVLPFINTYVIFIHEDRIIRSHMLFPILKVFSNRNKIYIFL